MGRLPLLAALLLSAEARAEGPFTVGGLVEAYLAYGTTQPQDGRFALQTTPSHHATPTVHMITVDAKLDWRSLRGKLILGAGAGLAALHAPNPSLPAPSPLWQHLVEANVGYTIPVGGGLTIDAGIMPSHIGIEVFPSRDNWNWSHAFAAELSPYYQAGLRVGYGLTKSLSVALLWLNGWGLVDQDHQFRSGGAELTWTSTRLSVDLNLFAGQLPGDGAVRLFADLWAVFAPFRGLKAGAVLDGGVDVRRDGRAFFYAIGAYLRHQPLPYLALSARADLYDDRGGAVTGLPQRLVEATLTVEGIYEVVVVRLEGRVDTSTEPTLDGAKERVTFLGALSSRF